MLYDDTIPGWMSLADLESINELSTLVPENGTILEIGSLFGRSTVAWAMSCHASVKIYCSDIFYENYIDTHTLDTPGAPLSGHVYNAWEEFQKNTKDFNNIFPLRGTAPDETNYNGDPIDLLFVDALHKNPSDWDIISHFAKFVKIGGIIAGHDYRKEYSDVTLNADKLSAIYETPINSFDESHSSIWSMKVTKEYDILDFKGHT